MKRVGGIVLVGASLVACGSSTAPGASEGASATLMRVDELAAGKLDTLPTGGQFVRLVVFHQAPGDTTPSRKHQAGVVYVETGTQRLTYSDGPNVVINAGTALYQQSTTHSHVNIGTSESTWFFIALWPSLQRGAPLVGNNSQVGFETEDIPANSLRPGSYVETLRRVTLQAGGRSPAHQFGGLEAVYVLDGTLTVKVAGRSPASLTTGQGIYVAPQTVTQEVDAGGGTAVYLAYFVTPQDQPFETDVNSTP